MNVRNVLGKGTLWALVASAAVVLGGRGPAIAQECPGGTWVEQDMGAMQNGVAGVLGPAGEVAISSDGGNWAQVVQWRKSPSAFDLYVNGKKQGTHAQILPGTLRFAPKGAEWSLVAGAGVMMKAVFPTGEEELFEAVGEAGVVFSPDGSRHAYSVGKQGKQVMVVDGKPSALEFDAVTPPVWSPDGAHLVYVALDGANQAVVVDSSVLGTYPCVLGMPLYSEDGAHMAFVAEAAGLQTLFVDGKAVQSGQTLSDSCPTLSKTGWACPVKVANGWSVASGVYGGPAAEQNLRTFEGVVEGSLTASADGGRWAFAAVEKGKSVIVVDGKASEPFDRLQRAPVFSPDGKRVGAVVEREQKVLVWLDGKVLGPYDSASEVTFSPDSSKVWFVAMKNDKVGLADQSGVPKEWCDGLSVPVYSADGKQMAWVVMRGTSHFVVRDGVVDTQALDAVADETLAFSPDGKVLAIVGKRQGKPVIWANGCVSGALDGMGLLGDVPLKFVDGTSPIAVGKRGVTMMKLQFKAK